MTIREVSSAIKLNRNAVAKYLEVMLMLKQVEMRRVGRAKLYYMGFSTNLKERDDG